MEPLNKGQVGSMTLVRCREVVPFSEVVLFSSTQKSFDSIIKRVWLPVCRMEFNQRLNGVSVEEQGIAFVLLSLAHAHLGFSWPRGSLTSCYSVSYFCLVCFSFLSQPFFLPSLFIGSEHAVPLFLVTIRGRLAFCMFMSVWLLCFMFSLFLQQNGGRVISLSLFCCDWRGFIWWVLQGRLLPSSSPKMC